MMETNLTEWHSLGTPTMERPSVDFIRAVAELLETDADDILVEMGYVHPEMAEVELTEV